MTETIGNVAREMASAPLPKAAKVKANRFMVIFGTALFKTAANDTVYTDERSGTKSKRAAQVLVPLAATGGFLRGSIYLRQLKNSDKVTADFVWFGANRTSAVDVEDGEPGAVADMNEYRDHVAAAFSQWLSAQQTPGATSTNGKARGIAIEGLSL